MNQHLTDNNLTTNPLWLEVKKNWLWLLFLGLVLIVLGTVSILMSALTTFISIVVLGVILAISGVTLLFHAFRLWHDHKSKFYLEIIHGLFYLIVGLSFIFMPVQSAIYLTLVLAVFYLISGVYRGALAISHKTPKWGWLILSAILSIALAFLILLQWPFSGLWIIGIFVGIDILTVGIAFTLSAIAMRTIE